MDDKHYPYIALSKEKYPRLSIRRDAKSKKYKHYGPFPDSKAAYKVLHLLNSIYPFRKCKHIPSTSCLYYHMKQCLGPCINKISQDTYKKYVNDITRILKGDVSKILSEMKAKMKVIISLSLMNRISPLTTQDPNTKKQTR